MFLSAGMGKPSFDQTISKTSTTNVCVLISEKIGSMALQVSVWKVTFHGSQLLIQRGLRAIMDILNRVCIMPYT
jgi:hypothetical protein